MNENLIYKLINSRKTVFDDAYKTTTIKILRYTTYRNSLIIKHHLIFFMRYMISIFNVKLWIRSFVDAGWQTQKHKEI